MYWGVGGGDTGLRGTKWHWISEFLSVWFYGKAWATEKLHTEWRHCTVWCGGGWNLFLIAISSMALLEKKKVQVLALSNTIINCKPKWVFFFRLWRLASGKASSSSNHVMKTWRFICENDNFTKWKKNPLAHWYELWFNTFPSIVFFFHLCYQRLCLCTFAPAYTSLDCAERKCLSWMNPHSDSFTVYK